jgi:NTP pyrophosphatase (non-canonical NTP hydrolase)
MAHETSQSIAAWGEETFGPAANLRVLVSRARGELDELDAALASEPPAAAISEAADVAILLHRLVHLLGDDLAAAVDHKMTINRARAWTRSGDGVGQHIVSDQE